MKKTLCLLLCCLFLLPLGARAEEGPPALPEGSLIPLDVRLPEGLSLTVHTGPGDNYPVSGKVSTNGWVQVFGYTQGPFDHREEVWLFIQYGISPKKLRFGYVRCDDAENLPGMQPLEEALPDNSLWVIKESAPLTDDPLRSQAQLGSLTPGAQVILLGHLGKWAHVETMHKGKLTRGFVMDFTLADAAWRDESKPFDLRAASWAPMARDYAATREQYTRYFHIYYQTRVREFNTWLRLDSTESRAALEALSNFRVIAGRATCADLPIALASYGYTRDKGWDWEALHFLPKTGYNRAALDLVLEPGEDIRNLTLACDRTRPDGRVDTITLPLRDVPLDMGYPAGGAAFTATSHTPFRYKRALRTEQALSLGQLLADELYQPMPSLPEEVAGQPYDTDRYALSLIQGQITKQPGDFGVYDVTFELVGAPEGLWLAAYEECGLCDEIDRFDLIGGDVILPNGLWDAEDGYHGKMTETLSCDFHILLLADTGLYSQEDLDALMPKLHITTTFSGEKWNMSYEQHYITSAIGPRSSERVSMEKIVRGEGVLSEMPR